jgi:hypothetical protein
MTRSGRTVAFFLGAGASKRAGVPISCAMTERVLAEINPADYPVLRPVLNYVVGSLIGHASRFGDNPSLEEVNVEDVVAACRLLSSRESSDAAPFVHAWREPFYENMFDYRDLWETVEKQLLRSIRKLVWIDNADKVEYLTPVLQCLLKQPNRLIYSLNYDNAIETLCQHEGIGCCYGLSEHADLDCRRGSDAIRLLKLHGSADWVFVNPLSTDERQTQEHIIRLVPGVREVPEGYDAKSPAMLFGRGRKLDVRGPFMELLGLFKSTLAKEVDDLVVIGYSLGDDHINYLVERWLWCKQTARLILVDPTDHRDRPDGLFGDDKFQGWLKPYTDRIVQYTMIAEEFLPSLDEALRGLSLPE